MTLIGSHSNGRVFYLETTYILSEEEFIYFRRGKFSFVQFFVHNKYSILKTKYIYEDRYYSDFFLILKQMADVKH